LKGGSPRRIKRYALRTLGLSRFFKNPGDGRKHARIPARTLIWSWLIGCILRECSFHGVEFLARSRAKRGLGIGRGFSDDTLAYFTERLSLDTVRRALASVLRAVKRGKAFDGSRFIGLAIDGTGAARCTKGRCTACRPVRNANKEIVGYGHHFSMISVVGTSLSLPFDVEPYGPGDSEYAASQRLLKRAIENLGSRFADYVVGDGAYATAPFLHAAMDLGLQVVVRLKNNLPQLRSAAEGYFSVMPPDLVFRSGEDRVELWDFDDFDAWQNLQWERIRVIRYRQIRPDGSVCEAYWLTSWSKAKVGGRALFHMAKARWEIENQGFNDAKTHYGLEHMPHHHRNSLEATWLLTLMAIVIERVYRLRYLKRGTHSPLSAIALLRLLRLSLISHGRVSAPG
jgi:hypothetical protein